MTKLQIQEVTTSSSVAVMLLDALACYPVNTQVLFGLIDKTEDDIRNPAARISSLDMQRIWGIAVKESQEEALGIMAAEKLNPAAFNGLCFAWMTSATLEDALLRLCRYFRLISNGTEVTLNTSQYESALWIRIPRSATQVVPASVDFALALFVQICRLVLSEKLIPIRIEMRRSPPDERSIFERFYGCDLMFNSEENRVVLPSDLLKTELPMSNPVLLRANDQVVIDYLSQFDKQNIVSQVHSMLIESLPTGRTTQESIARKLNTSSRSLQRKLKEKDTSFSAILESTRKELASQYLRSGNKSIGEITFLLGFSEVSNFNRAFKRWYHCTPLNYQTQQSTGNHRV